MMSCGLFAQYAELAIKEHVFPVKVMPSLKRLKPASEIQPVASPRT